MILFEEAMHIVMGSVERPLSSEQVNLQDAVGRILLEDVVSDMDMPPFNKSAMDGYACRRGDIGNDLHVLETIPAGCSPTKPVGVNECSKIMTGAPVPDGADCVIMVEYVEEFENDTIRFTGEGTRANICEKGEDVQTGDVVVKSGVRLLERHMAVLASVGCVRPMVACRVRVGVITTGDELVEPSSIPGPSQIRNSNASQLVAQIAGIGAKPTYYGIIADSEDALAESVKKAAEENDVILLSGGVSMGDFDFVPQVLRGYGFDLLFEKIAIQPGKPTIFGKSDSCFCFGLPGNPVSTYVLFEKLVKPFLFKMMGHDFQPDVISMKLGKGVRRRKTVRATWLPVVIKDASIVEVMNYHGSAHLNVLPEADGFICIPIGVAELEDGAVVDVSFI